MQPLCRHLQFLHYTWLVRRASVSESRNSSHCDHDYDHDYDHAIKKHR